jgi:hypothetical protein
MSELAAFANSKEFCLLIVMVALQMGIERLLIRCIELILHRARPSPDSRWPDHSCAFCYNFYTFLGCPIVAPLKE